MLLSDFKLRPSQTGISWYVEFTTLVVVYEEVM